MKKILGIIVVLIVIGGAGVAYNMYSKSQSKETPKQVSTAKVSEGVVSNITPANTSNTKNTIKNQTVNIDTNKQVSSVTKQPIVSSTDNTKKANTVVEKNDTAKNISSKNISNNSNVNKSENKQKENSDANSKDTVNKNSNNLSNAINNTSTNNVKKEANSISQNKNLNTNSNTTESKKVATIDQNKNSNVINNSNEASTAVMNYYKNKFKTLNESGWSTDTREANIDGKSGYLVRVYNFMNGHTNNIAWDLILPDGSIYSTEAGSSPIQKIN